MLNGYKTFIGGSGAILTGIGMLAYNVVEGNKIDWNIIMGWIVSGWTIIGGRSAVNTILDK